MKKLHITINTRVLLYFLFVTILPLAILAVSSTILIQTSLSEKSGIDVAQTLNDVVKAYNANFNDFREISNTYTFYELVNNAVQKKHKAVSKNLLQIKDHQNLDFVSYFTNDITLQASVSKSIPLIMYPSSQQISSIKSYITALSQPDQSYYGTEILSIEALKALGIQNKFLVEKKSKITTSKNVGVMVQIAVIPLLQNSKKENASEESNNVETDEPKELLIGYLIVGNYVNSPNFIDNKLGNVEEIPLNIMQEQHVIAHNDSFSFNIANSGLEEKQSIREKNSFEEYVNDSWYEILAEPIYNSQGQMVGSLLVGLDQSIFRTLKHKNNLLILHISVLVAAAGLVLAFLFSKSIANPISRMAEAVRSFGEGDLPTPIDVPSEDELGELAISINRMVETIRQREKDIVEQKSKLEAVLTYSADGIITVGSDKKLLYVNSVVLEWLQRPLEEVLGEPFYSILTYKKLSNSNNKLIPKITEVTSIETLKKSYNEAKINDIDLEISYSAIEIKDYSDEIWILVLRDITKRKETEELRENFIATLTHDLRVPLIAEVQTLKQLMKGSYGDLNDTQKYITEQLINSNEDLLSMVNTLLDTYSYEAGKQYLVKRDLDIVLLIQDCISDLTSLFEAKQQKVFVESLVEKSFVKADKQEIKRVLVNLLSNAITHTPEKGTIKFSVENNDMEMIVSIEDNGIGLAEEDKCVIFQRYCKGTKVLRKIGTGLGLYLSRFIVEAHGGKIWVESEINKGSTFYFTLPLITESLGVEKNVKAKNTPG